jgi:hypothetical protein
MSDKDRRKKDGERKDKKNQAMREAVNERREQTETPRQHNEESDLTGSAKGKASA